MGKAKDLTGQTFNQLTVISSQGSKNGKFYWLCACTCGETAIVRGSHLTSGNTQSCGCLEKASKLTHGKRHDPSYKIYRGILDRCYNSANPSYSYYGGRGIKVCDRWRESIENFLLDVGKRPNGASIDRIDNNGNYEPNNCRWASRREQQANRRDNRRLTLNGETKSLTEWATLHNLKPKTIKSRLRLGWSTEKALTTPTRST